MGYQSHALLQVRKKYQILSKSGSLFDDIMYQKRELALRILLTNPLGIIDRISYDRFLYVLLC